ncbi:MAG: hypothetical protein LC808_29770 [Actinobacteria bacterium]|nr:hypothetical protein [Actinomycetota bacterium]
MPDLDEERILLTLLDHGVDFVVIGATAAIMQGAAIDETLDLDVTAAKTKKNLDRLAAALRELEAELRLPDADEHVALPLDARMLANVSVVTLSTRYGPLDVLFAPAGAPEYANVRKRAVEVPLKGTAIRAAAVEDLIAMKRAAGREKDLAHLGALSELLPKPHVEAHLDASFGSMKGIEAPPRDEWQRDQS